MAVPDLFRTSARKENPVSETRWSGYEATEYVDNRQNWKNLEARKGRFQEIHPGYFAARDGSTVKRLPNGRLFVRLVPAPLPQVRQY